MHRFACKCKIELELEEHYAIEEEHEAAAAIEAKDEFQELVLDMLQDEIECKCTPEEWLEVEEG